MRMMVQSDTKKSFITIISVPDDDNHSDDDDDDAIKTLSSTK